MVVTKLLGEVISVDVPVRNNGQLPGTAYVRVSLVLPPAVVGLDLPNVASGTLDGAVTLNPGESAILTFSGQIPFGTDLGLYDTVGIARTGPDLTGDVLDEVTEPDQVNITGVFDVEIQPMTEY